jgi:1,4-dihydroxy-2-naphthoyl-CoA hydrolase
MPRASERWTAGSRLTLDELNALGDGALPGLLGLEVLAADERSLRSRLVVRPELLAPNGYLHAATVVALADTSCGYGCRLALPPGGVGFTTIELKANFLGTALSGGIACLATLVHGGRTTQVWDAKVTDEDSDRTIALFRCTQMVLYPPAAPRPA